ncbi:ABC transporter ATP-binding protein [Lentibacter algarum]|uniref:ABC transporter ATP-binding protein n=1 Tax=Lentibacter algarum TaxID=576131 RepID=UPI001C07BB11|nr:ABC transporter ATP-binding protein [Lentibacter algarum]MBU2981392.1 ABC transporter ATP-binding protein [Lentibacter algarum]
MTLPHAEKPNLPVLSVRNLSIRFGVSKPVLQEVFFDIHHGETLALVGESGSGKTLSCRAIIQLLPKAAEVVSGQVIYRGGDAECDLLKLAGKPLRRLRGGCVSMIFQEPMRSLSPLHTIGNQVGEMLALHSELSKPARRQKVLETLARVGLSDAERAYKSYPFEMSGGMRQRAMIAMAIITEPEILIADEPTTALDVTTQATVLGLLKDLQKETGMAIVLVTHDLGVVANMADKIAVMESGQIVESGPIAPVLSAPKHSYTRKLIAAAPVIPEAVACKPEAAEPDYILTMRNVCKSFSLRASKPWQKATTITAMKEINLAVTRGKTLAVVGESGSGKTTCGRIALGAMQPDEGGEVHYCPRSGEMVELQHLDKRQRCAFQQKAQMVFQDPYSTLNPRMRVREALFEPMEIHKIGTPAEREARACEILGWVGLKPDMLDRYPHAFSGGQRQRLSIARALMMKPEFLVCDEPTSALDVSVQEQVLALLRDLQARLGLSYLFISHDLAVVASIADSVAVMRAGVIVEQGPVDQLFRNPLHPYTKALIAAHPEPDVHRPMDLNAVAKGAGSAAGWPEEFRLTEGKLPPLVTAEGSHLVRRFG